jgi:hypothetical protein
VICHAVHFLGANTNFQSNPSEVNTLEWSNCDLSASVDTLNHQTLHGRAPFSPPPSPSIPCPFPPPSTPCPKGWPGRRRRRHGRYSASAPSLYASIATCRSAARLRSGGPSSASGSRPAPGSPPEARSLRPLALDCAESAGLARPAVLFVQL